MSAMRLDKRWWLLVLLVAMMALYFAFDIGRFLSLPAIKSTHADLRAWRETQPLLAGALFFAGYLTAAALSLPGAAVMTLAAGALFGLGWATLIVSFASTLGATLAFLASRWLLAGWVQSRFGARLAALNAGIAKDGGLYLFTLRLVPLLPFFVISLAMGVTPLRTWTFYWASQLGMLAGTLVYVNAGTQLARIESLSSVVSPGVPGSLAPLGACPLITRKLIDLFQSLKVHGCLR